MMYIKYTLSIMGNKGRFGKLEKFGGKKTVLEGGELGKPEETP